jgi:hypothetical protein
MLFQIDVGSINVARPCDSSSPTIAVSFQISANAPGVYPSDAPGSMGQIAFVFNLPIPSGVECSGSGPDCSPGCEAACDGQGCLPCTPQNPTVYYEATAGTAFGGREGSWTLTLTSAGSNPHGKLEAELVGSAVTNTGDAGPDAGNSTLVVNF